MKRVWTLLRQLPANAMIAAVRCYQYTLSPLMAPLGVVCRFQPTCSHYFIDCVKKYGAARGAARGAWRLCRCHPFSRGGFDPP